MLGYQILLTSTDLADHHPSTSPQFGFKTNTACWLNGRASDYEYRPVCCTVIRRLQVRDLGRSHFFPHLPKHHGWLQACWLNGRASDYDFGSHRSCVIRRLQVRPLGRSEEKLFCSDVVVAVPGQEVENSNFLPPTPQMDAAASAESENLIKRML